MGDGGTGVVGSDDATLSFFDVVGRRGGGRGGVGRFKAGLGVVASGRRARSVGPGDLKVFAEFFRCLKFHEGAGLGKVDTRVVGEVAREDDEESLSDD